MQRGRRGRCFPHPLGVVRAGLRGPRRAPFPAHPADSPTPSEGKGWRDMEQLCTRGSVAREQRPDLRAAAEETGAECAACLARGAQRADILPSTPPSPGQTPSQQVLHCCPGLSCSTSSPPTIHSPSTNAFCAWEVVLAPSRNNSAEEERFHKEDLFWCHRNQEQRGRGGSCRKRLKTLNALKGFLLFLILVGNQGLKRLGLKPL